MLEEIEDTIRFTEQDEGARDRLSDTGKRYIEEVLPLHDEQALVDRVDEIQGGFPPKAINSDKDIAEAIKPVIEEVDPIYLEAPTDSVQIEQAADAMEKIEGLSFDEWKELSFEERVAILQLVEGVIAEIAHRPSCVVNVKKMDEGNYGSFNPNKGDITLNSRYIKSDTYEDYKECIDTIVHEGRHAYQH